MRGPSQSRCCTRITATTSSTAWASERKRNLTQAYHELAALYTPAEARAIGALNTSWEHLPAAMPGAPPFGWGMRTRYRKGDLYKSYTAWATEHPSAKQFYNKVVAELNAVVDNVIEEACNAAEHAAYFRL